MSSRSYLSIGDVLTLLREEFPDVTISKIRFLESQGLVNPERSPSGYRKFFETDVERLRWVLRQQREHFLPLKVIRDRLADGDLSDGGADSEPAAAAPAAAAPAAAAPAHVNGRVPEPVHAGGLGPSTASATSGGGAPGRQGGLGPGRAGTRPGTSGGGGGGHTPATATPPRPDQSQADDEAMARILADASRRSAQIPEQPAPPALLHAVPDPGAPHHVEHADHTERAEREGPAATPVAPAVPEAVPEPPPAFIAAAVEAEREALELTPAPTAAVAPAADAAPEGTGVEPASSPVPAPAPAPAAAAADPAPAPAETAGKAPRASASSRAAAAGASRPSGKGSGAGSGSGSGPEKRGPATTGMVTGASLTADELCAASGLSAAELAGLQGFGLVEPVLVAGIPTYDEDDLTVANLAAEFRKFGIEARHLRPYRNAVDREVGLIEQVIIPLLRQRNPESRQRAIDAADELGALGQAMRATLMRTALRRHVGG